MTTHRLSRRTLLRATAAAGGAAILSSCARAPGGAVDLAYWNFFGGSDGELMVELVNDFRTEAPGVRVTDTTLDWGPPYYTKLAMACAGGRAPDLATLHASRLATFGRDLLDEWDLDELAARGVSVEEFPQPVLDRVLIDGRLMALPLDTHPLVLYYNTDICERAGLLAPDGTLAPITSAEQMLDAGRRAAEVTGSIGIALGIGESSHVWMVFWSLFRQLGGADAAARRRAGRGGPGRDGPVDGVHARDVRRHDLLADPRRARRHPRRSPASRPGSCSSDRGR